MLNLFISNAYAQAAATPAVGQPSFMQYAPLGIVIAIFYFVMIRPHKKQLDEERKLISELTKGCEVYTKSGMLGTIVGITDKIITLEVSEGVKLKVLKSQIAGLAKSLFEKQEK